MEWAEVRESPSLKDVAKENFLISFLGKDKELMCSHSSQSSLKTLKSLLKYLNITGYFFFTICLKFKLYNIMSKNIENNMFL